jgi:predicted XRE-type DNA-binding protein
MAEKGKLELVHGSGNVFRDFGDPDGDVRQAKAILAARIIGILDENALSTRKAQGLTGVDQADFTRIRNAQLDRFTIDRLMTILNRFNQRVEVTVRLRPIRC